MRSPFAYTPSRRPLQAASPGAAAAYLGSLVAVSFAFSNPLVVLAAGVALVTAGLLAGSRRAVGSALWMGVLLGALIALVNGLVVSRGATVVARLGDWPVLGRVDVTAEALADGAALALLVVAAMVGFAVYSACVDPDRVLRALRPLAGRSALTATLVSRLVPVAAADARRLRDAARLRGPGASPVGRAPLMRRLLAGSLDRAVDVAATLELRGYGSGAGAAPAARRRSRHDARFWAIAAAVLAVAAAAKLVGAGGFRAYPTVAVEVTPASLALAAALLAAGLGPLQGGGSGFRRPAEGGSRG